MANGKKSKSENVVPLKIVKPTSVFERFKSKKPPTIGGVGELLQPLPLLKISEANDFVRLSPADEHWSPEMCFVAVPVHGEKRDLLHCIDEEIADQRLVESGITGRDTLHASARIIMAIGAGFACRSGFAVP
jgi:hypothetical protein